MISWLASYPRSGNTFFRMLLHSLFGLPTFSVYPIANERELRPDDTESLMRLTGQSEVVCDLDTLRADAALHFVKTHDLPSDDDFPAIVLIRDGRDAVVSYAHFVLKVEHGIDKPSSDVFEAALEEIITGDRFGGWSNHVNAWMDRVDSSSIVRYEELLEDPVSIAIDAVRRLGVKAEINGATLPSFQELQSTVPWFFRRGKPGSWIEMPSRHQELFLQRHGDTLVRLGYSERVPKVPPNGRPVPPLKCAADERLAASGRADDLFQDKERRLQGAEQVAAQRLEALRRADDLLQAKEQQLQASERAAAERLEALRRADDLLQAKERQLQEVACAAEERLEALRRANDLLQTKEGQLHQFEQAATERLDALLRATCVIKEQGQRIGEHEQRIQDHEQALELQLAALSNAQDALSRTEARANQLQRTIDEFSQESILDFLRRRQLNALRRG